MVAIAISFKRTYASTVVFSAPDSMAGHCPPKPLLEPPGHSQASLPQSFVVLLGPGVHKVLLVPSKCLFPQSCGSSIIKTHWPSKSNSLGGSQSLCQIPGLGNLLWSLELPQQCKHFFCIIVLQFVGCLFSGSMVGLTCHASHVCCTQSPCPPWQATGDFRLHRRHSNTKGRSRSVSCGVLVHTRNFVRLWALWASLVGIVFDSKCDFSLPPSCWSFFFALGCGVSFWWDPTFSC